VTGGPRLGPGVVAPELQAYFKGEASSAGQERLLAGSIQAEQVPQPIKDRIASLVQPFFSKYDADRSGFIDAPELQW
jgi:hypothetical protein